MTNFEKVGLFMKTFGQEVKNKPSLSTDKINQLRISLINEELEEFKEAIKNKDINKIRINCIVLSRIKLEALINVIHAKIEKMRKPIVCTCIKNTTCSM